jgi:hypothetical protein
MVLRRILIIERGEVRRELRKLCNEGLQCFLLSPNVNKVISSSRSRWVGDVSHMEDV